MKLVDILARELKVWPHNGNALGQAADTTLHLNEYASHGGEFYGWTKEKFTRAEDHHCAFVTRAQWQAAVDALKVEVRPTESMALHHQEVGRITRQWNGEGLPHVGTVIEWLDSSWVKVVVVGHHKGAVVAVDESDPRRVFIGKKPRYRTFLTPEQIAAEERDLAIDEMLKIAEGPHGGSSRKVHVSRPQVAALYDAGYRKFEIVES